MSAHRPWCTAWSPCHDTRLQPAHGSPESLGGDVSVAGAHTGVPVAQGGHDDGQSRALTSETSRHVVPEVVEMEVAEPKSSDKSLEGPPDGGTVELRHYKGTRRLWECPECGEEYRMEGDSVGISILCKRECQYHGLYVYVPTSQVDECA